MGDGAALEGAPAVRVRGPGALQRRQLCADHSLRRLAADRRFRPLCGRLDGGTVRVPSRRFIDALPAIAAARPAQPPAARQPPSGLWPEPQSRQCAARHRRRGPGADIPHMPGRFWCSRSSIRCNAFICSSGVFATSATVNRSPPPQLPFMGCIGRRSCGAGGAAGAAFRPQSRCPASVRPLPGRSSVSALAVPSAPGRPMSSGSRPGFGAQAAGSRPRR